MMPAASMSSQRTYSSIEYRANSVLARSPLAEPDRERLGVEVTPCDGHGQFLELRVLRLEQISVQTEKELCGGDPNPLVTVHEGVVHDQRMHQSPRLRGQVRVEIFPSESHRRP